VDDDIQRWSAQFVARFGKRLNVLFNTACWLRDRGYHEAAIITAQTACEFCTEMVLTDTFDSRGIGYLTDPVSELLPNYNLAHEKVRKVYDAVANDAIAQEPFWPEFVEHSKKRNKVAHRGEKATRPDADASIAAVEKVIRHIQQHYASTWRSP
jgi:hypothetical protein